MSFFRKKPEPEFPPVSWNASGDEVATAARVSLPETPSHELESHLVIPGKAPAIAAVSTEDPVQGDLIEEAPGGLTASSSLARRIRDLIPSKLLDDKTQYPPPPSVPSDAPPPPPPAPAWLDTQLARLLESAEVMNGTLAKGKKSVWDTLEQIRAPKATTIGDSAAEKGKGQAGAQDEASDSDSDDDSSVMLYAPLIPTDESKLELAEREIVETDAHGRIVGVVRDEPSRAVEGVTGDVDGDADVERKASWWPFKSQKPRGSTPADDTPATTTTAEAPPKETFAEGLKRRVSQKVQLTAEDGTKEDLVTGLKRKVSQKLQERAVWVPSPTQISFQATWYGYRIYLPPPVLAVLDDKSLTATKRAAMLTTSIQWLFGKLPMAVVPLQFRPGVLIAKRFLPYIGYIGAAIAWGWSGIRGYDKGNGVVMSATWLLPLAILPNTWDTEKYPRASENVTIPVTTAV